MGLIECKTCMQFRSAEYPVCRSVQCTARRLCSDPTTQKARGFKQLPRVIREFGSTREIGCVEASLGAAPPLAILRSKVVESATQDELLSLLKYCAGACTTSYPTLMARPCPQRPRHGFVDSRCVATVDDLRAILRESLAADPDSEVLITQFIKASYNVVATEKAVTVGTGHEGATSGRNALTIPVVAPSRLSLGTDILSDCGVHESPYLEAVLQEGSSTWTLTQLRDGPTITGIADFIPHEYRVTNVFVLDKQYDLLEWERLVGTFQPGTAIYNESKFGLQSHYGVHAVIRGIPFVTTFRPEVGNVIQPARGEIGLGVIDQRGFVDGLKVGLTVKTNGLKWGTLGVFALAALHNFSAFTVEQSRFIGAAVGISVRLGLTALYGEARHMCRDDRSNEFKNMDRHVVYKAAWAHLGSALYSLPILKERWLLAWDGSFGGGRWAACQESLEDLLSCVYKLCRSRSERTAQVKIKQVLASYNQMVNTMHNGGKWFNKFYDVRWLDIAAERPWLATLVSAHVFHYVNEAEVTKQSLWEVLRSDINGKPDEFEMRPWNGVIARE